MEKGKELLHLIPLALTAISLIGLLAKDDTKEKEQFSFYGDEVPPTLAVSPYEAMDYLATLQYPPHAKQNHIEARVIVSYFIETDGSVAHVGLMPFHEPVDEELKEAALSFVRNMPKWNPGTKAGMRQSMHRNMIVRFKF